MMGWNRPDFEVIGYCLLSLSTTNKHYVTSTGDEMFATETPSSANRTPKKINNLSHDQHKYSSPLKHELNMAILISLIGAPVEKPVIQTKVRWRMSTNTELE